MGKKRKQERSEEDIRRKIRKLQEKLTKKTRVIQYSSEEDELLHIEDSPSQRHNGHESASPRSESPMVIIHHDGSPRVPSPRAPSPRAPSPRAPSPRIPSPRALSQRPDPPPPPTASPSHAPLPTSEPEISSAPAEKEINSPEELELDEDILQLLGDAPKTEAPLGPSIHKDVASRWQEILSKGLSKESKDKLLKEYLVPSNCDLLLAPTLNPEAKAALPEALAKRDMILMQKQKQLGVALSALATVMDMIISNETSKQKILKPLSDACRILCDSHHTETKTRRNFVISSINTSLKDMLLETSRDKLLFGENISEKLKAAKTIQRSGEALKNSQKPTYTKNNFTAKKGRLNFKQTHRKTDNKTVGEATRSSVRPPQRQQRSTLGTHKVSDRSPPSSTARKIHRR